MAPPGPARAQLLWRLGRLSTWGETCRLDIGDAWLAEAEEEAGDDPWLAAALHRSRFWVASQRYDHREALEHARRALESAESAGDPAAIAASLAMVVWARMALGDDVAGETIERAMRAWEAANEATARSNVPEEEDPAFLCGEALTTVDRLDEARLVGESWRRIASEAGSEALCLALANLCEVELRAGNWELADRYADEAASRDVADAPAFAIERGMVDAYLGRVNDARRNLELGLQVAESRGVVAGIQDCQAALGFLVLSVGDLVEAHRHLSEATRRFLDAGIREPGMGHFLADEVEVLVGLGELAEAERLTDWLEERGRALDRVWALAAGARCRGPLLAAKGDLDGALGHLERAMAEHERLPMPFERARTLLALGTIRRHAKQKRAAREALEEALSTFDRLGAALWSQKARAELSSIGGRPPATGALTPTEERVARLAAAGRTNLEIADTLYLSVRTVEGHLSRAYHKLGVRSRTELALHLEPPGATT